MVWLLGALEGGHEGAAPGNFRLFQGHARKATSYHFYRSGSAQKAYQEGRNIDYLVVVDCKENWPTNKFFISDAGNGIGVNYRIFSRRHLESLSSIIETYKLKDLFKEKQRDKKIVYGDENTFNKLLNTVSLWENKIKRIGPQFKIIVTIS